MEIKEYSLTISNETRTLHLIYYGNENLIIKCNTPQSEEGNMILFPLHILKKFIEIIDNE